MDSEEPLSLSPSLCESKIVLSWAVQLYQFYDEIFLVQSESTNSTNVCSEAHYHNITQVIYSVPLLGVISSLNIYGDFTSSFIEQRETQILLFMLRFYLYCLPSKIHPYLFILSLLSSLTPRLVLCSTSHLPPRYTISVKQLPLITTLTASFAYHQCILIYFITNHSKSKSFVLYITLHLRNLFTSST